MILFLLLTIKNVILPEIGRLPSSEGTDVRYCMDCSNGICQSNYSCRYDFSNPSYCYTYWSESNNGKKIYAAGCYAIDDNCGVDCIAYSESKVPQTIRNENLSLSDEVLDYKNYFCCCSENYCNSNFVYLSNDTSLGKRATMSNIETLKKDYLYILLLLLPVLILIIGILYVILRKRQTFNEEEKTLLIPLKTNYWKKDGYRNREKVLQMPPTKLENKIFSGDFASVWTCSSLKDNKKAAVKLYSSENVDSWLSECKIYLKYKVHHENILECKGAAISKNYKTLSMGDIIPNSNYREIPKTHPFSLNLLMEYHVNGNLDHYLEKNELSTKYVIKFITGICKGLSYLHSILLNSSPPKPCIAHRDMKCTNILVKEDGTCCISDFGLAIALTKDFQSEKVSQAGTIRYMAPEVLDGCISYRYDSLSMIDLYSLGLIIWEILSRCNSVQDYNKIFIRAFEKELGNHPTKDLARELISKKRLRPQIKESWANNEILNFFSEIMTECWEHDAEARITSSCLLQRIKLCEFLNLDS